MRRRSFARALEACFAEGDRAAGRALLRRRRVRLKALGPWIEVRVRDPDGDVDVLLSPDPRGVGMSCPCARFKTRGTCGHAFAAVLALDREERARSAASRTGADGCGEA